jgi:hypothetical protein
MIVTIMQPAYLPWLGFFDRIAKSEKLIMLDHVAIDRNSKTKFANRNRIRTASGSIWLSVPILTKGRSDSLQLDRIEIATDTNWPRKHLKSIELNYANAAHFDAGFGPIADALSRPHTRLHELNRELLAVLFRMLGLERDVLFSSQLGVTGRKQELIINLCQAVGADAYISGPFGRDYLDRGAFADAGITVLFQDYHHPIYQQAHAGFEPNMATLDLLLNVGPSSLDILTKGQELSSKW